MKGRRAREGEEERKKGVELENKARSGGGRRGEGALAALAAYASEQGGSAQRETRAHRVQYPKQAEGAVTPTQGRASCASPPRKGAATGERRHSSIAHQPIPCAPGPAGAGSKSALRRYTACERSENRHADGDISGSS